jgi:YidC/Oxa1 family membrane protein insertase
MDSTHTAGVIHQFIIQPDSYLIDWNISLNNAGSLLTNNTLNFHFVSQPMQVRKIC